MSSDVGEIWPKFRVIADGKLDNFAEILRSKRPAARQRPGHHGDLFMAYGQRIEVHQQRRVSGMQVADPRVLPGLQSLKQPQYALTRLRRNGIAEHHHQR